MEAAAGRVAREATSRRAAPLGADAAVSRAGDALGDVGWADLLDEARTGIVDFAGGELRIQSDAGDDPDRRRRLSAARRARAVRGARAAARAIRRLDIGGSIGIDLPTVRQQGRAAGGRRGDRRHLPQPFERTAVNGFGFVQIVRPRRRASLVELAQDRAAFEARALLRRAAVRAGRARSGWSRIRRSLRCSKPAAAGSSSSPGRSAAPSTCGPTPRFAMSAGYAEAV